jgi:hypothetical protein
VDARPEEAATLAPILRPLHFLLMRYARSPSPLIAKRIADCVSQLLADRNFQISAEERCTYRRMRTYWRLVERLR